jgi:hypothetical protein
MHFDIAMPTALFVITVVAMFIEEKLVGKLKTNFEEREFRVRDAVFLVAAMAVMVSLIVFIPQMAIMVVFLFAYSSLLFTFSYIFSTGQKVKAQLFCLGFGIVAATAATLSLLIFGSTGIMAYGVPTFYGLVVFAFAALVYEEKRGSTKERWYIAVLPAALFIFLYLFLSDTNVWQNYLVNVYAITFAILIVIYLGGLFTWKTTLLFAGLLTIMDIILVLVTGSMVSAAKQITGLHLPVIVYLPRIPIELTPAGGFYGTGLGLGDFFFAGLIATQSYKKFGRNFAILSAIAMAVSFGIYEVFWLNSGLMAFPGTLMIICGWLPLVLIKSLKR